jgi:hypothetical protein
MAKLEGHAESPILAQFSFTSYSMLLWQTFASTSQVSEKCGFV